MLNYIILYADEFNSDVWEEYCDVCDVPHSATEITIKFVKKNVDYVDGED